MRKSLVSLLSCIALVLFSVLTANAQITITVTNPTNTTPNLAPSYASLTLALTDLNNVTAMTGPVTLTCDAGTSETAPATGFTIGSASLNAVLSATNTVTIVKASGTVTINAGVGTATPGSAAPDGMLKLNGADYITIDGLTFTDGNVTNPATMEFGIALFKRAAGDGCNNNTIQNCTFNMQRVNNATGTSPMIDGSVGLLIINSTSSAATTALTPTNGGTLSTNGTNSGNRVYANSFNSGNYGIGLSGYAAAVGVGPSPTATTFLGDLGNDIGGTSLSTGNSILNYGGGAATNPAAGIRANNQWSINISYNTVNNNNGGGVNHATTLRGIYGQAGTSANATINNNNVTIHGGATTSQTAAIENVIGSTASSNTVSVSNNTVTGDYLTATSGTFFGILQSASAATVLLINNSVSSMSYSGAALTGTGTFYGIQNGGAATTVTARLNNVNGLSRTGTTGGTLIGLYISSGTNQNANSNTINNLSHAGTGTGGIVYGIQTTTATLVCDTNTVTNLAISKATGTGNLYGIYNIASPTNENYNYNQINNITHSGTGVTYGLHCNTVTGVRTVSNNVIHTVSTTGTTCAGMLMTSSSPSVFKNKIYNISSSNAAPTVSGIIVSSVGTSGSATLYNNLIGDIKAPNASVAATSPAVRGINLTSATATSTLNIYNNTVYLNATSVGANFTTCALYHTTQATATTAALTIKGNAFINNSTPTGTGLTIAYQRSSTTLTNYVAASDYNLFYAGTPGAANLIFYDGTNSDQTLAAFKSRVSTREINSVTENTTMLSTTGSSSNFLRPDSTIATFMESGATTVSSPAITADYRGVARYPNSGYPNNGTYPAFAPDLGAYEFGGIWLDVVGPAISYTALLSTGSTGNRTLTAAITDPSGVQTGANGPRLYYKKSTDIAYQVDASPSNLGNNYTFTLSATALGGVTAGDIIQYYVAAQDLNAFVNTSPAGGSGSNPPGTTAPGAPNSYTITAASLSGSYTIGTTLFRPVGGGKLEFVPKTRTIERIVSAKTDYKTDQNQVSKNGVSERIPADYVETVTETYMVPMVNGVEYTGPLYREYTDADRRELGLSDNMAGDYATLAAAITDLNTRGVSGATTFSLTDASYSEAATLTISVTNENVPTASNTVTFKPSASVTPTITVTSTGVALSIASPYVIIDGSNNGSTSRDMTLANAGAGANSGCIFVTSPNSTIKNLKTLGPSISLGYGIVLSGTTVTSGTVQNCDVQRAVIGIQGQGGATNFTFSNNLIGSTDSVFKVTNGGLIVLSCTNWTISGNTIVGVSRNATANTYGVQIGVSGSPSPSAGTISNNIISNVKHSGFNSAAYAAIGIGLGSDATNANITTMNNSVYDIYSQGDGDGTNGTLYVGHGIYISAGGGYKIYNNSVNLFGAITDPDATLMRSGAMTVIATNGSNDIRNNIFANSSTYTVANASKKSFGMVSITANTVYSSLDYNNYYASGVDGILGYLGSDRATLSAWQTATGKDASSIIGNPGFTSNTNLAIDGTSSNAWNTSGMGVPIAAVTTDILGAARSTTIAGGSTDLGAYNVTPSTTPPTATASAAPANSTTTTYTLSGRTLGSIDWGAGGTVPSSVTFTFYPGTNPPGSSGFPVANGYWVITVPDGSGYTYDVTINYDEAMLGDISPETDMRLAKSDNGGALYTPYIVPDDGSHSAGMYTLNTTTNTIKVWGLSSFSTFGLGDIDNILPVELSSFTANTDRRNVNLKWSTTSEENNAGFDVERKSVASQTWSKIGNVSGNGTTNNVSNYSFDDRNVETGKYNYRLKQIDNNGNFKYHQLSSMVDIGVPSKFDLSQNYPNPFNPSTKINYDLPFDSKVSIRLFDMTGKEVAVIVNATQTAGYYTAQFNGANLASGVYFYNIIAEGGNASKFVTTKKMVLVK